MRGFAPALDAEPADERLAALVEALARLVPVERPVLLRDEDLAPLRFAVELLAAGLLRALLLAAEERELVERDAPDLELPDREPPDDGLSSPHLPDITRCAASVIASAISEPRRVALDTAVVAALDAASAASSPASRILRRAAGLALIAAAAAASPAASISRLIAALVSLSTVESFEPELDFDELFLLDFAIANLPWSRERRVFRSCPSHDA